MSKASALSTLGNVRPTTRKIAEEIWDYLHEQGYDLTRLWGMGSKGSEHPKGRAIDFMITGPGLGKKVGDLINAYAWKHRKRLRLKWSIWDHEIWSTTPDRDGKERGKSRYNGKNPHTDHVHIFVAEGAYVPPTPSAGGGGGEKGEWWHVDPKRVSTFLWGLKNGEDKNIKAKPGRNILIVAERQKNGKTWLVTEHNNWFSKYYMNRGRS